MFNKKQNTNLGENSLFKNESNNNSAIGFNSLKNNIKGTQNSAFGSNSLENNISGISNVAVGYQSLQNNDGKSNTSIGSFSGITIKNGTKNILIGRGADVSLKDANNQIVIGANTLGHGNNVMVLGNDNILSIEPSKNKKTDLGSSNYQYRNLHINGGIFKNGNKVHLNTKLLNDLIDCASIGDNDSGSIYIGEQVGLKTKNHINNVIIGKGAFQNNINGSNSVGIGQSVLKNNTKGNHNTALGNSSLENNINGNFNTSIGSLSLLSNKNGSNNTSIGTFSLGHNISGNNNNAIGYKSLYQNRGGNNNNIMGYCSGNKIINGSNNICIGNNVDVNNNDDSNVIVIGNNISSSNGIMIGVDDKNISNSLNNNTWTTISDIRLKENIENSNAGLEFINDLRPITFNWKKKGDYPLSLNGYVKNSIQRKNYFTNHGFIAQEVKEIIDKHESIKDGFSGWSIDHDGTQRVGDSAFIPIMIKAIQELSAKINELENKLIKL